MIKLPKGEQSRGVRRHSRPALRRLHDGRQGRGPSGREDPGRDALAPRPRCGCARARRGPSTPRRSFRASTSAGATSHRPLDGKWHYVEAPKPELYDLEKDPAERCEPRAGDAAALPRRFGSRWRSAGPPSRHPASVDPEEAKKLASLGYLSSGATAGTGPLPDPKDEIVVVSDLKTGSGLFHAGRYDEAIAIFLTPPRQEPANARRLGPLLAVAPEDGPKRGGARRPQEGHPALARGRDALPPRRGEPLPEDRKGRRGRRNTPRSPSGRGDPAADDVLARIHLARKEWDAAEKASALAALKARPNKRFPYSILARVAVVRNDLAKALELVEKGRASARERTSPGDRRPPLPQRRHPRADAAALDEAEAEFKAEIRLFPDNLDAWTSLTALYAVAGTPRGRPADGAGDGRRRTRRPRRYATAAKTLVVVGDKEGATILRTLAARKFPCDRRFRRGA